MKIKRFNRILIISMLILGLSLSPVFAATQVDQETLYPLLKLPSDYGLTTYNNGTTYMYRNNGVGYALGILGQVLSRSLYQVISNTSNIYSAVDGVESSLSTISGKIKDYTSYVDGLETALSTSNTRLQSILTAVQGITTYNYTSVLNSILANTNYISAIESHLQVTNSSLGSSNTNGIWGSTYSTAVATQSLDSRFESFISLLRPNWKPYHIIGRGRYYDNSSLTFTTYQSDMNVRYPDWAFGDANNELYSYRIFSANSNGTSFSDWLNGLYRTVFFQTGLMSTANTTYRRMDYNSTSDSLIRRMGSGVGGQSSSVLADYSIMDRLTTIYEDFLLPLSRIQYVVADSDTIQRKKDNAAQAAAALDNFSGSGSAAASVSDINAVKDSVGSLKDATSGGASFSQAFNAFSGDSDGWSWFSQENADAMDTTGSGSRMLRSCSGSSTPYLDAYYSDIFSILGGGDVND